MRVLFKIIFSFFIIISSFSITNFAETNRIREITITINIKEDGTAIVTEVWKADIFSGTELYHSFENLDKNIISNFVVYEDGIKYKKREEWDITRNPRR